jgi:radical SAM-linked protein
MRTFERAMRRSRIPVAYSQGFNPHPQMIFGLPLSVGVTSEAEYADFEFAGDMLPGEFIDRLNRELPSGLRVIDAKKKNTRSNIMASISAAAYDITVFLCKNQGITDVREKIGLLAAETEIKVQKEGKKGLREIDIRPMIRRLEPKDYMMSQNNGMEDIEAVGLSALLSAGSTNNLKPELLVNALGSVAGLEVDYAKIHRTGLYIEENGKLYDPLDDTVLN